MNFVQYTGFGKREVSNETYTQFMINDIKETDEFTGGLISRLDRIEEAIEDILDRYNNNDVVMMDRDNATMLRKYFYDVYSLEQSLHADMSISKVACFTNLDPYHVPEFIEGIRNPIFYDKMTLKLFFDEPLQLVLNIQDRIREAYMGGKYQKHPNYVIFVNYLEKVPVLLEYLEPIPKFLNLVLSQKS